MLYSWGGKSWTERRYDGSQNVHWAFGRPATVANTAPFPTSYRVGTGLWLILSPEGAKTEIATQRPVTLVSPSVGRRIPTFADDVNFDRPLLAIVGESRNYLAVNSRRNTAFNAQINTSNFPVENPTGEVGNLWKGLPTASCWINSGFLHLSTRDQVCEISVILTHVKIHIWIPCQNLNFK
jgi:hypothetical protein